MGISIGNFVVVVLSSQFYRMFSLEMRWFETARYRNNIPIGQRKCHCPISDLFGDILPRACCDLKAFHWCEPQTTWFDLYLKRPSLSEKSRGHILSTAGDPSLHKGPLWRWWNIAFRLGWPGGSKEWVGILGVLLWNNEGMRFKQQWKRTAENKWFCILRCDFSP